MFTATHSKFSHISDSRTVCEPFLYAGHVVFGSDDCRMLVYLRKPRTFIVLYPSFEGVSSPCVRIGKHIVQYLDWVAERNYQRIIACCHSLSSFALIHSSRSRLHSSSVGFSRRTTLRLYGGSRIARKCAFSYRYSFGNSRISPFLPFGRCLLR